MRPEDLGGQKCRVIPCKIALGLSDMEFALGGDNFTAAFRQTGVCSSVDGKDVVDDQAGLHFGHSFRRIVDYGVRVVAFVLQENDGCQVGFF